MVQSSETKSENARAELRFKALLTILCTISLTIGFFGSVFDVTTEDSARYFYMAAYVTGGYAGLVESFKALLRFEINVDILMTWQPSLTTGWKELLCCSSFR